VRRYKWRPIDGEHGHLRPRRIGEVGLFTMFRWSMHQRRIRIRMGRRKETAT
jgi:hypothetical protein